MLNKFVQCLFSINNIGKHKIITILGLKIKLFNSKKFLKYNPYGLIIDTTIKCNNNCSFCWRRNKQEYLKNIQKKYNKMHTMDFKIYKKIIDDAVKYDSITWLSLCGPMGEPLLNDKIEDFFEYAAKKNHFKLITLNTNGLAINKKNIANMLNSIDEFSISVDSIDPDTYEKIHGNKKFLPVVIDNIKNLIEYKKLYGARADIVVRFTENAINCGQYPEFKKFFTKLGVDRLNYTAVHSFAGIMPDKNNVETVKMCNQPKHIINFNFKGELTTCCINWELSPVFGNIRHNSIAKLWHGKKYKAWADKFFEYEPCKNCSGLGEHVQKSNLKNN